MFYLKTTFEDVPPLVDMYVMLSEPDTNGKSKAQHIKTQRIESNITRPEDTSFATEAAKYMRDRLRDLNNEGGVQCWSSPSLTDSIRAVLRPHQRASRETDATSLWAQALSKRLVNESQSVTVNKLEDLCQRLRSFRGSDQERTQLEDRLSRMSKLCNHLTFYRAAVWTTFCGSQEQAIFDNLQDDELCALDESRA